MILIPLSSLGHELQMAQMVMLAVIIKSFMKDVGIIILSKSGWMLYFSFNNNGLICIHYLSVIK